MPCKQFPSRLIAIIAGLALAVFLFFTRNFVLTFILAVLGSFAFLLVPPSKEL